MEENKKKQKFSKKTKKLMTLCICLLSICIIGGTFLYIQLNPEKEREYSLLEGNRTVDKYKELKLKNNDFYAWLQIDDTNIDFPVVYRDNEFYLTHDFNLEEDPYGIPFIDERCDIVNQSENLLIHGHSTLTGPIDMMFDQLVKYKDQNFYENHKMINFDTVDKKGKYEIAMIIESRIMYADEENYRYYNFIDTADESEWNMNMEELKKLEIYDTGVEVKYGDQLITLSTCDLSLGENGRFVVVAKEVKDN